MTEATISSSSAGAIIFLALRKVEKVNLWEGKIKLHRNTSSAQAITQ